MKILQPKFEIWAQPDGLDAVYKQIERAGRVCYKSEQNTTETSARPFVERMIASEHFAMLEHGTVYLHSTDSALTDRYDRNRFSHVNRKGAEAFITTNMRVLAENKWLDDLKFISSYTPDFERRITVHFTTQVGVTREYNRHRANSMAEQSTRYCNYSKDKFGGEISINMPTWIADEEDVNKVDEASRNTLVTLCQQLISNTDKDYIKRILVSAKGPFVYTDFTSWNRIQISKQGAFKILNKFTEYGILKEVKTTSNKKLFDINKEMIAYEKK